MNFEFKVWDREEKLMYEVSSIYFPLGCKSGKDIGVVSKENPDVSEWRSINDVELLQWTGLYDDTGVKIFNNDIVVVTDGRRKHASQVRVDYLGIWINTNPFIQELTGKIKEDLVDYCDYGIGRGINQTCKVIGNIYTNPERLHKNDWLSQ